jgi:hypothetical protein
MENKRRKQEMFTLSVWLMEQGTGIKTENRNKGVGWGVLFAK